MKKSLLSLTLMLALASMAMAQDVYTSGNYTNEAGYRVAAVYKNGELLYSTSPNATLDHESSSVLYLDGDVYWVDNCYTSDNDFNYGDVFRNGERWLSNPVGSRSRINVLLPMDRTCMPQVAWTSMALIRQWYGKTTTLTSMPC